MNGDFADELEELITTTTTCLESALMSDDFLQAVDQSLGVIPNIVGPQEPDDDTSNTS